MEIYTLEEVSNILKIPQETIRKYLRQGKIEGSKIGRTWRVTDKAINDFMEKNSNMKGDSQ